MTSQTKFQAASLLVGERLIRLVVGFFIHAWMARTLSPEDFGFISYIIKGVAIYYTFGLFGTDEVIMKELASRDQKSQKDVLRTVIVLRLIIGLLGWILMSVISGLVSGFGSETWLWMTIFGVTIPIQAYTAYEIPYITKMSMQKVFYARNSSYFIGVIGKSAALLLHFSKNIFVQVYLLEEFCWKIFIGLIASRDRFTDGKYNKDIHKIIFKPSVLIFLAAFIALLDQRLPFFFIEYFTDSTVVGQYAIIVALLDIAILIPISMATALFPSVVHGKNENQASYLAHRQSMSNWLVRAGLSFSIIASIGAPLMIQILYRGKYSEIIPVFRLMVFSLIFYFFNIGRLKWFILEGALKEWMLLLFFSLLIQSILLAILIPHYGLMGVSVAVLVSQILPNIILVKNQYVRESIFVFFRSFKF